MQKYKLMLILPFIILIVVVFGSMDSKDREEQKLLEQQAELVSKAQLFADDEIYFRAADTLKQAIELNVGDINGMELRLMEYYIADDNMSSWLNVAQKRIRNGAASEDEILSVIEYYRGKKDYDGMYDTIKNGLLVYPQSEKIKEVRDQLRYSYSYQKLGYQAAAPSFWSSVAVEKDGKWGYIKSDGSGASEFIYDDAASFCGSFAAVRDGGKICVITDEFKRYSVCHDSSADGVFLADSSGVVLTSGEKYLLADYEMQIIGELYDFIGSAAQNMRAVKSGNKWFFINANGEKAIPQEYDGIALNGRYAAFFDGIAFVSEGGSYKMINEKGEAVGTAAFEDAYPFMEKSSLAAVKKDGKWGFADKSGEIVIPCTYDGAKSFSYGLAAVCVNGKWGYIDLNNNWVIPAEYNSAEPFENKKAAVFTDDGLGMIYLDYYR